MQKDSHEGILERAAGASMRTLQPVKGYLPYRLTGFRQLLFRCISPKGKDTRVLLSKQRIIAPRKSVPMVRAATGILQSIPLPNLPRIPNLPL
nr:MAG TPA: hypothetical protein [Bacteriophage sp.]